MAVPTIVIGTAAAVGNADATPTLPTHQADDWLYVDVETVVGEAVTCPTSGWAQALDSPQEVTAGTVGTRLTTFCKLATSSSETNPTIQGDTNHKYAVPWRVRGAKTTGEGVDVAAGGNGGTTADTTLSIGGDTTTGIERLIVNSCARGFDSAAAQFSGEADATLTNLAELHDAGTALGNGGGIGIWSGEKATAGAYGPMTATLANNSGQAFISRAFEPASTAVTGTIANTEENDTSAFTGTVANPVTGTIAVTEETDTPAIAAVETFSGTIAATETDDTSTISGSVANPVTGTMADTEGDDSANFSGTVTAAGVTGTIAVTEDDDTSAFSGNSTVPGTMVTTEDNDSGVFAGTVANPISGTAAPMEGDDTSAFTGLISNPGTIAVTEDDDTANLVGVVANQVTGTIAVTEDDDTATFTGTGATGLNLPATATISDADNSGTIRDRSPVGVLSSADRTGTIRR